MKRAAPMILIVLLISGIELLAAVGIGAKLLNGGIPFIVGELGGESLSVELGVGLQSVNLLGLASLTMIWYSGIARVAFPVGSIAPYVGAGGIGLSVIVSSDLLEGDESGSMFGVTGEGGLRYSFEDMGLPLRIYGGVNVNWYPLAGLLEDLGIGGVAMGWHVGAVVPF
ncbi:hypothetical protein ACFLS0_06470 [Candidatus Bipolaricaulota bacterium]